MTSFISFPVYMLATYSSIRNTNQFNSAVKTNWNYQHDSGKQVNEWYAKFSIWLCKLSKESRFKTGMWQSTSKLRLYIYFWLYMTYSCFVNCLGFILYFGHTFIECQTMVSGHESEFVYSQRNSMKSETVVSDFNLPFHIGGGRNATLDGKGEYRGGKREAFLECLIYSVPRTILGTYFIYITISFSVCFLLHQWNEH